jgi:hypothetical protein
MLVNAAVFGDKKGWLVELELWDNSQNTRLYFILVINYFKVSCNL